MKLLLGLIVILFGTAVAQDVVSPPPLYSWNLTPANVADGSVTPVKGDVTATVMGPLGHSSTAPQALMFDGNDAARHRVEFTDNLSSVRLPETSLTVEAWVMVEKPLKWGGICGVLQDNGEYERGWLLGFRETQFCFAVASAGKQRLTYLTDTAHFEFGFWYHVVGTYDGQLMTLYVDGRQRATSKEQQGAIAYPPKAIGTIGCYLDDDECHVLTGQIEQVSIHETCLSADAVAAEFKSRSTLFPGIQGEAPDVAGWPTYRRDSQRTAMSAEKLNLPLHLQWSYQAAQPPDPAWPPPARDDFWNHKHNLQPRVTFDRAYHSVCVDDLLYFASSADDKVYCLDANTGEEKWSFFTEGPVRLAPTIHDDTVLFGSDDGNVYCLDRSNGDLRWTYRHDAARDRRIPGNERIISTMAVRSGVLVEDGVAFFCTGLFPGQGVYQVALDVQTGRKLASGKIDVSAQGYLERRSGRLFVPAARDPAGSFAAQLTRRGKGVLQEVSLLPDEFPYAFIGARDLRFGGGDGVVAAMNANDGAKLWSAQIDGKAYGLSICNGRLFVNTDSGMTYCFSSRQPPAEPKIIRPAEPAMTFASPSQAERSRATAVKLLTESNVRKGYCLVWNSGDGVLAYQLARNSDLKIVCVEADSAEANRLRRRLDAAGMYGRVVVHHRATDAAVPYTDYMFNLIVDAAGLEGKPSGLDRAEVIRLLRPGTGVAFPGPDEAGIVRRPKLDRVGEWSHMYGDVANTCCSADERVRGRMALQWFGEPGPREMINRHHRTVAPLWKNGRLFIPGNNRIFAADAYNGTLLWNIELPESRRIAAFRDCSYLAATDDYLFAVAGDECHALNAETGYSEHSYDVPDGRDGSKKDWGYVANVQHLLVGSGCKPGASRREHTLESIMESAYFDARDIVCSDFLFAYDHVTTEKQWVYYATTGAIVNSSITIGGGTVFFVESNNAETLTGGNGRYKPAMLVSGGADVVAVDLKTGTTRWRKPTTLTRTEHNLYMCYAADRIIAVGTRNSGTDKATARVVYNIEARLADSGAADWDVEQIQDTKIDGDHGEQDLHPVVVGERLYCEPVAYHVKTGEKLDDWGWTLGKRRGCGNISASASTFFFRQSNPTAFDLLSKQLSPVTTSTRPGCLINMIPAGGLLLIPEASSGCTCNYGVQTSLAFLPIDE
ncbi:MAG: PQQ-binding-like beta-propeller repeat protein [Planctomycetaceae bacterium]